MIKERKYLVSVNKKYSQTEVFSFEVTIKYHIPDEEVNYLSTRQGVAMGASESSEIPEKYFLKGTRQLRPEYWVDAICVD